MKASEAFIYIISWFPRAVPILMRLLFQTEVIIPHNRVDISYRQEHLEHHIISYYNSNRFLSLVNSIFIFLLHISYRVFNIPHYFPVHNEAEVVVDINDCVTAIKMLKQVVDDFHIPLNYLTEVSCDSNKLESCMYSIQHLDFRGNYYVLPLSLFCKK